MGLEFTKWNTKHIFQELNNLTTSVRAEVLSSTYPALYVVFFSILEGNTKEKTWKDQHSKTLQITEVQKGFSVCFLRLFSGEPCQADWQNQEVWECEEHQSEGSGKVHISLGPGDYSVSWKICSLFLMCLGLAGWTQVWEVCESAWKTAERWSEPAGTLLHVGHDDSFSKVQSSNKGKPQYQSSEHVKHKLTLEWPCSEEYPGWFTKPDVQISEVLIHDKTQTEKCSGGAGH